MNEKNAFTVAVGSRSTTLSSFFAVDTLQCRIRNAKIWSTWVRWKRLNCMRHRLNRCELFYELPLDIAVPMLECVRLCVCVCERAFSSFDAACLSHCCCTRTEQLDVHVKTVIQCIFSMCFNVYSRMSQHRAQPLTLLPVGISRVRQALDSLSLLVRSHPGHFTHRSFSSFCCCLLSVQPAESNGIIPHIEIGATHLKRKNTKWSTVKLKSVDILSQYIVPIQSILSRDVCLRTLDAERSIDVYGMWKEMRVKCCTIH